MRYIQIIVATAFSLCLSMEAWTDTRIPYFECLSADDGKIYRIAKQFGENGRSDAFVYEDSRGEVYSNIAYLQNNRYTKSSVKEDEDTFEVIEREDNSSIGLGPGGVTLPAIAWRVSSFVLNKRTGDAEHVYQEKYMLVTVHKKVKKFANCFDLRH